jgi:hypothetical protein
MLAYSNFKNEKYLLIRIMIDSKKRLMLEFHDLWEGIIIVLVRLVI